MRHRIQGRQLCRDSEHRRAMLKNLAAGLFEHGQVETTLPKAKSVQPLVEKIITTAKRGGLQARRRIEQLVNDRKVYSWVADPNVPDGRKNNAFFDLPTEDDIEFNRYGEVRKSPRLVQHIMTQVAARFADRDGGYTRIIKTDRHRLGDGTDLVILQLAGDEKGPQLGGGSSRRRKQKQRRRDFAAKFTASAEVAEAAAEGDEVKPETEDAVATDDGEVVETEPTAETESADAPAKADEGSEAESGDT